VAPADDGNDPLIGRVLDGRFTIQSVLGRGGMGVVYRAHQASLERSVALKLMTGVTPERAAEFQRRFFLEAATAARLKHPNTITVFDYGSSVVDGESVFFITMELLEGQTLSRLLTQGRALPPPRAIHIGLQICRSLREAHKAGVVHRDLKPGNVMIVRQDEGDEIEGDFVKVLDFGLAKSAASRGMEGTKPVEGITKAGTFMGSPRYVAPEQVEGQVVDHRADIYSFGCLLYRMLTGRVPFDGKQPVEIMMKHIKEAPPLLDAPGVPQALVGLVADCLQKDPARRPATMDEVAQRLKLARAELAAPSGQGAGGIVVRADDAQGEDPAFSLSSFPPTDGDPPPAAATPPATSRGVLKTVPRTGESVSTSRPRREPSDWGAARPGGDDSTRPTRVLGQISLQQPPRRPWAAIGSGLVIGLALCGYLVAWRLDAIDPALARRRPQGPSPATRACA
jgi:eukaryotic-like serine/threonine-protein kinase